VCPFVNVFQNVVGVASASRIRCGASLAAALHLRNSDRLRRVGQRRPTERSVGIAALLAFAVFIRASVMRMV
jgi:hypothetical protein